MKKNDVSINKFSTNTDDLYTCLISDRPCGLVPVDLRRGFIIPLFGSIEYIKIYMPLEKKPNLVFWQYLRMLRFPLIFIFTPIFGLIYDDYLLNHKFSTYVDILIRISIFYLFPILSFLLIGQLLKRYEFVRFIGYDKNNKIIVRFNTVILANKARLFFEK